MGQGDWLPRRGRFSCRIGRSIFSNWTAKGTRFVDERFHPCRPCIHDRCIGWKVLDFVPHPPGLLASHDERKPSRDVMYDTSALRVCIVDESRHF